MPLSASYFTPSCSPLTLPPNLVLSHSQFAYCQELTKTDIERLLSAEGVLAAVVQRAIDGVIELKRQRAATGAQLSSKFATESKFTLQTGSLDYFYRGLEGLLGPPSTDVFKGMEREHTDRPDSHLLFDTSNGVRTTSRDEYEFVVRPVRGKIYPERASLLGMHQKRRRPLSVDEVWEAVAPRNAALRQLREAELLREEAVAGRLYSGPMYEKYNAVLRAESGDTFLVQKCEALTKGNRYATSIHAVTSCVLKLAKVTKSCTVYRGLKDAQLPEAFFTPNQYGVRGGIEFGFTSTSKHRTAALTYAGGEGGAPTVFEMQTGMVDRGASISVLSQYPWEEEILFAPLLGMEVMRTRVDGGVLIVMLRLTVNLTALSLEQQLSKRKRLVHQMCEALRDDLKYDQTHDQAWEALALLRRGTDGWCGHEASFSTLDGLLNAASDHDADYYNDDQAWGDAIAASVAASQRVQAWPSALARVAALTHHDVHGLMTAAQLVLNFKGCGLPVAEVMGVLLRVSSRLHMLTLYDGSPGHDGVSRVQEWSAAVAALAAGLRGGAVALTSLNLRHFYLGRDGNTVAAALAIKPRLHTVRLIDAGLRADALSLLLRGNTTLVTLDLAGNPAIIDHEEQQAQPPGDNGAGVVAAGAGVGVGAPVGAPVGIIEGILCARSAVAGAEAAAGALAKSEGAPHHATAGNAPSHAGDSAGATLARFITGNLALCSLGLARCALPPHVGALLVAALEQRIDTHDTLKTLDVSDNQLDSPIGLKLAAAQERSDHLIELSHHGNPMDPVALAALNHAREVAIKAWLKTDEAKADPAAQERRRGKGTGDVIESLMSVFS